jgi:hypothetical protein
MAETRGLRSRPGWATSIDGRIHHQCSERRAASPPRAHTCARCRAHVPPIVRLTSAMWKGWRGITAVA